MSSSISTDSLEDFIAHEIAKLKYKLSKNEKHHQLANYSLLQENREGATAYTASIMIHIVNIKICHFAGHVIKARVEALA